jgi:hypothetical protein
MFQFLLNEQAFLYPKKGVILLDRNPKIMHVLNLFTTCL